MTQASVKQRKRRKAFREQQNTESASDLGQGADHIYSAVGIRCFPEIQHEEFPFCRHQ